MDRFGLDSQIITRRPLPGHATMGISSPKELEAQAQKKRHIAAKLLLKPGQKILDIGSGWGGLGLYLAEIAKADVTGLTLSDNQHEVSNKRARTSGVSDRVRFKISDYRHET